MMVCHNMGEPFPFGGPLKSDVPATDLRHSDRLAFDPWVYPA